MKEAGVGLFNVYFSLLLSNLK